MSLEQEVELIRQFPIFSKIQPAMQKLLCFSSERLTYDAGQVMFNAGDAADAAYIIIEGAVKIVIATPSGPLHINDVERHGIFGEIGMFGDLPRSATAIASAPPELGEHTDEILGDLGYDKAAIEALRQKKVI